MRVDEGIAPTDPLRRDILPCKSVHLPLILILGYGANASLIHMRIDQIFSPIYYYCDKIQVAN